jgi:uncharacterized protein (DUF1501 family)
MAPTVPGFLANTARATRVDKDQRVLVVIQLDGGNDGINTVVSFKDEGYAKHRRVLRLPKARLIKVNNEVGLHPSLRAAGELLQAGKLAIVQGVSYPNPNRSHFRSMAIWHSARLDPAEHGSLGWLGRALDKDVNEGSASMFIGTGPSPVALRGRRSVTSALETPEEFALSAAADPRKVLSAGESTDNLTAFVHRSMLDAYSTADRLARLKADETRVAYPSSGLANHLQTIARLIKAGLGARVYYTQQAGYDTHSAQLRTHSELLFELASALKAFLDDLNSSRLADRVVVLMFSEFGRTVSENASAGTDHGTCGPVFLAGPRVKAGLLGTTPSLMNLDPRHGDLRTGIDFRQVYATVLEKWLGIPSKTPLGGAFDQLPLFC